MAEFDGFSGQLFEEAKRFLEKAQDAKGDPQGHAAYLHAALMLSFSALEARMNSIGAEAAIHRSDLTLHEKAALSEKEVRLVDGQFEIIDKLRMMRLEERLEFTIVRMSGKKLAKSLHWFIQLKQAIHLRNDLTHPKNVPNISQSSVSMAMEAIVGALDALSFAAYGKRYPAAGRGLSSKMTFK
jgi:hypothetical protein